MSAGTLAGSIATNGSTAALLAAATAVVGVGLGVYTTTGTYSRCGCRTGDGASTAVTDLSRGTLGTALTTIQTVSFGIDASSTTVEASGQASAGSKYALFAALALNATSSTVATAGLGVDTDARTIGGCN